ncbi:ParM/StbA family protein [uncultured Clostridium sp.]|uniref:ParM/StbA family protein n=1 Tax=uncultured Clostridium sp. TaxID=59620 RepID=UPI0028ED50AA|nr:ParM/StbA family protein [uncultured Clostridium sp.]
MQRYTNLKNAISIHGLDIGNATLINSDGLILDAKITTIEPVKEIDKIVIDGKTYYLGYGSYDTTFRKIEKEHYLDMMYGLLALTTKTVYNYVGLGLPLGQYKADRENLIDLVLSNDNRIIKVNDELEKSIVIKDVEVFPEGVSTLKDDEECIVIDVGGGTTDCGLVVNEHGKRKVLNPISIPKGTIKLYDKFANKLISKGLDVTLEDAERILNRGYLYQQGTDDINFAMYEYEEFVENLISKLQLNYNLKIYPISITGGGGEILYNQLKKRFRNIRLQPSPIKANANAYYELGCSIWQ